MWNWIGIVVGSVLFVALCLWGFVLVALRTRSAPMLRAVRRSNRALGNRLAMRKAGRPGASASVVRHVGRRSGRQYETPITVNATEDGFVVVLPYGTSPDWLRNVLRAGSALVVSDGTEHRVDHPEIVTSDRVDRYYSAGERRIQRLYGIDQFLLLREAEPAPLPGGRR